MKVKFFRVALMVAAAGLLLAACGPQTVSFSTTMTEFEFDPPQWEVPAGAQVELTLTNDGTVVHDWVLMPQDYEADPPADEEEERIALQEFELEAGETETFTFTAPSEAGEYTIICAEPGHLESGMMGTMIVE